MKNLISLILLLALWDGALEANAKDEPATVRVQQPSVSPAGDQIVFAADFDGPTNLWIIGTDGQGLRKLTYNSLTDDEPAWSPDGQSIAFASTHGNSTDIWRIHPDGSNLVRLTSNASNNRQPAWSPDGQRIAFVSDRGGPNNIWIMNADGSAPVRVTNLPDQEEHPSFSPSGDRIVFSEINGQAAVLMTVASDGSSLKPLTSGAGPEVADWNPVWTSTGIVFSSNRDAAAGHWTIWIVQQDSSGLNELSRTPALDPAPLPDGRIAFSDEFANSPAITQLTLLDPVTGTKQMLTDVSKTLPDGDVNNDGTVDCHDRHAIRRLLNTRVGQAGFNPRADIDHNGRVDGKDLLLVERKLSKAGCG